MQFGTWDTLFNLGVLIFWFRMWTGGERSVVFNPYLASFCKASGSAIEFLRPVFFGLPDRPIAAFAVAFLMALRAVAAPRDPASWVLRMGFEIGQPIDSGLPACLAFSALSFGLFLFKLWGFSIIFTCGSWHAESAHTTDTLHYLSRPLSEARIDLRPLLLLGWGFVLALLVNLLGEGVKGISVSDFRNPNPGPMGFALGRYLISALAGWTDVLPLIQSFLILLIIGSWISMFTGAGSLAAFCHNWSDLLLGPLRRFPIRVGMLDLTPLVLIIGISLVHPLLRLVLWLSYRRLL